ncbi:UNVERIFIED_CONTAM: HVA22-like protein k [Sesamum angustifolium]|uniref:HVA22-like protein k n=1 Tax=Sesamum angustifolium TaxID=2727405 RepID=A0AAW2QCB2_9LAMI
MAVFGSNMSGEVGLRLLLCPLGSNVVIRTACCSVGIVLPVYSTFKAIEAKDQDEQHKWLLYWAANHAVQEIIRPGQRQVNDSAIEGPPQQVETSESEDEE